MENSYIEHGLSFECEILGNRILIRFEAIGKLTHEDYEKITPIIDDAASKNENAKIDILIDISKLQGWELRAAWDDFKIGLKYRDRFNKIAIVGDNGWKELMVKISDWFISGEAKSFDSYEEAISWIEN